MTQGSSVTRTARDRARDEVRREIRDEARRQLAEVGAAALSLRSVARELGMFSSAVYRYYRSRDELLTDLIVEAYDALGQAAEDAESAIDRRALFDRWSAICHAAYAWARANPHQYALIYGTPVPGYVAPSDRTVPPALRITALMMRILLDAAAGGRLVIYRRDAGSALLAPAYAADLAVVRDTYAPGVPVEALARGFLGWTLVFGAISFVLFGRLDNVAQDVDGYFTDQVRRAADHIGIDS